MTARRISKPIQIGGVTVGGNAPIVVQSMTKTDTRDVMSTINQINELAEYGCELVRVAVPDAEAAGAISAIKKGISLPLIADIHFDYRLALAALEAGADGQPTRNHQDRAYCYPTNDRSRTGAGKAAGKP